MPKCCGSNGSSSCKRGNGSAAQIKVAALNKNSAMQDIDMPANKGSKYNNKKRIYTQKAYIYWQYAWMSFASNKDNAGA